jgi:hypothetical protein
MRLAPLLNGQIAYVRTYCALRLAARPAEWQLAGQTGPKEEAFP